MISIAFFLVSFLSFSSSEDLRIINGTNVDANEFPFMVSLQINSSHVCGGTVLNQKFVLTAAHCVFNINVNELSVTISNRSLTSPDAMKIPVESINCHKNYSRIERINDIALLELSTEIPKDRCYPVKLAPENFTVDADLDGVLIGWGVDNNNVRTEILQKVSVIVYDDASCALSHFEMYDMVLNMCAGWPENGRGSCRGDSGGPLLVNDYQVGIIAFGLSDCRISDRSRPRVLSRVSKYLDWIEENSHWENNEQTTETSSVSEHGNFSLFLLVFGATWLLKIIVN